MIDRLRAPIALAASTGSRSDHARVLARVIRPRTRIDTTPGLKMRTIVRRVLLIPSPLASTVTRVSARMSCGYGNTSNRPLNTVSNDHAGGRHQAEQATDDQPHHDRADADQERGALPARLSMSRPRPTAEDVPVGPRPLAGDLGEVLVGVVERQDEASTAAATTSTSQAMASLPASPSRRARACISGVGSTADSRSTGSRVTRSG